METKPLIRLTTKQMLFHLVAKGLFVTTASFLAHEWSGKVYDKVVMTRYIVHEAPTAV